MSHLIWYPGHKLIVKDIVRAEGYYLYDSKDKKYIDLESGVWCTSIGYGYPDILKVISEQGEQIAHNGFNFSSEIVEQAAQIILSLVGFENGRTVFLCSGSEAVEYGVRVAQMVTNRPLLMTMADSYFGAYGSASKREENEWFLFDWFECASCPEPGECIDGCKKWKTIPFGKIGGFLFEPGSSSGLVRFPPKKLIKNIVATVINDGGLYLVNEVTTGAGRTGKWFGYQHYDARPDIIAMGKGIGNGYPVSVTAFAPAVIDRLKGREVKYAQSHQNDPLGAAVVIEVIRIIQDEGLIERCRDIGAEFISSLKEVQQRTERIREIRGRGLMIGIELDDRPDTSFTISTHQELIRRGFLIGRRPGGSVLRLDPCLAVSRRDLKSFLETFEDVLSLGL